MEPEYIEFGGSELLPQAFAESMGSAYVAQLPKCALRPLQTAARVTLHSHLTTVAELLTWAANDGQRSPELVHQLRIQTRRCLAAITAYQACLPKQQAKWFRKRLRQIRCAANDARDLDVFLKRYEHEKSVEFQQLRQWVKRRRREAQKPIRVLHRKWISTGVFAQRTEQLLQSIRVPDSQTLAQWSLPQLAELTADCVAAAPRKRSDVQAIHHFRVRVKSLRYAVDLFSPVLDPAAHDQLVRRLSKLQKKLGKLNDHATAITRLQTWQALIDDKSIRNQIRKLIKSEQRSLRSAIKKFDKAQLRKSVAQLNDFRQYCESAVTSG